MDKHSDHDVAWSSIDTVYMLFNLGEIHWVQTGVDHNEFIHGAKYRRILEWGVEDRLHNFTYVVGKVWPHEGEALISTSCMEVL